MGQKQEIEQKAAEALNSLDGLKRAAPQPWFYTRLMTRMQQEQTTAWAAIGSFLSKPGIAIASLCMILVMNVFFLVYQSNTSAASSLSQHDAFVESESLIASSSSFDYENIVP